MLTPTYLVSRITDLDPAALYAAGIRGVLLDKDNTLTHHHDPSVTDEIRDWLQAAEAVGIRSMVVSNSRQKRVRPFAEREKLDWIALACKPLPFGFWRASRRLQLPRRSCLVIGDQCFTDVLGAKLGGYPVALTTPFEIEHGWSFAVRRRLEIGIRRRAARRLGKENAP
ncbi:MAG: YqeG family HAD IIIA-type phosphatase [Clostridia bacterium]|nr:YqeG family HAD IIIA-type phosphatase [Clostridia bacterium]